MDAEQPVVRLVDIRNTPLDVGEVSPRCPTPPAGGLALFVGAVRDHDAAQGRDRPGLHRAPERRAALQEVAEEVATEYDVLAVAAVHRVGPLALGDTAVVVAPTAVHRGEAFEASRALIDRLKATVPIWKHQLFTDGSDEWVGTP